jgi:hypothetical protein
MKRSHWMTAAACFVLAASAPAWAAPAPNETSSLGWVPAKAPLVVHLNGVQTLRDHVVAFVKNAVPDQAGMVQQQIDGLLKNGFQGRKLAGLAKNGPIYVVVTDLNGDPNGVAIIAGVTSYSDFRDNILTAEEKKELKSADGYESATVESKPVYFVDKKSYVVVTPSEEQAAAYAKKGTGAKDSLEGKMTPAQAERFLASDAGVYVNLEAVNEKFGDQIKAALKQVDEQLDKASETIGKEQKTQLEMGRKIVDGAFEAVEDGKTALVTSEISADGVAFHTETDFRPGTPTADSLKGFTTDSFQDLDKLPPGELGYFGVKLDPPCLKFFQSAFNSLSENQNAKGLGEVFEEWAKSGPTESIASFNYPVTGLTVMKCADPQKGLQSEAKMMEKMGTAGGFPNVAFKDKPEIKPNAEKYGDVSFTSVHMAWDFDKMMNAGGASAQLPEAMKKSLVEGMKKLMGEETNAWIGADGKAVIQVTAKDWESAQKMLDNYYKGTGGIGQDKAFAAARKQLPKQATFLGMIDAVQAVGEIMEFVKPIMESAGAHLPPNFPTTVKGKPGFIGAALTLGTEGGGIDVVVTAEAVKQIYQGYVVPLMPGH